MQKSKSNPKYKISHSPDTIIRVNNLTKRFYLPHEKVTSFKESASRLFRPLEYEKFTALDNISFNIENGEFIGIVGRNGSGKSTLLKILAGIYRPTSGIVAISGKVSPLLEFGVGFNPELTAKENIFLYGIVLGARRREIEDAYGEIVSFSGLKKFMDAKLKNFSSGMQVRLAFSVAVQIEAKIYLVDEVMAVGDLEFQKKCYRTFYRFKKEGKTVIYVSHDLDSVKRLCERTLWLNNGKVADIGKTATVIKKYRQ